MKSIFSRLYCNVCGFFNLQKGFSECGNISKVTVKGQKSAPVVINVKKGETKNQCPQQ